VARREAYYGVDSVECRVIWDREGGRVPVLFLHGYSFTGQTWDETGVLDRLTLEGYPWAAPDMPYGRRTQCTKHTRDVLFNVAAARAVVEQFLGGEPPVIVGASLGGRIAVHYAVRHEVRGLFLLAPALRPDDSVWDLLRVLKVPAVIVAGKKDRIIPYSLLERLAVQMGARLLVYDAGHAMYLEEPGRFVEDLLEFLGQVDAS